MTKEEDQWTLWDPFCSCDGLTAKQRVAIERAAAWEAWGAANVGEPYHFDYEGWLKMQGIAL